MKLPNEYTCNNHGYFMHIYRKSDTALITPFSSFPFVKVYLQWSHSTSRSVSPPLSLCCVCVFLVLLHFIHLYLVNLCFTIEAKTGFLWMVLNVWVCVCLRASTCIYMSDDGEKVNIQTERSFGFCTAIMFKNSNFLWSSLHN